MRSLYLLKLETLKAFVGAKNSLLEECDTHHLHIYYTHFVYVHIAIWTKTMLCDAGQQQQNHTLHNMFIT